MGLSLDVGCEHFKRGDIGVDYSRNSLADIIADAHHLPFKNETFTKTISVTVLEHSPNPLNFLKEQYRVLKKGGEIEVTTDNAQYFSWSVMNFGRGGCRHEDYYADHFMIFYPKNVIRLLELAGFKGISYHFIGRKTKIDSVVKLLIKLGIWRNDCQYFRFIVTAHR